MTYWYWSFCLEHAAAWVAEDASSCVMGGAGAARVGPWPPGLTGRACSAYWHLPRCIYLGKESQKELGHMVLFEFCTALFEGVQECLPGSPQAAVPSSISILRRTDSGDGSSHPVDTSSFVPTAGIGPPSQPD